MAGLSIPQLQMEAQIPQGLESITRVQPGLLMEKLAQAIREASLLFVVRFPNPPHTILKPAEIMREALDEILLEPCDVVALDCTSCLYMVVLTPRSGSPFDPLQIHSILSMFKRAIGMAMGLLAEHDRGEAPEISPLMHVGSVDGLQENIAALNELLETIINKQLRVQFQPIVSMNAGRVYGYEALIRVPQSGLMKRPGLFYQAADRARLVSWLDIACQERCFESAVNAKLKEYLFINMDAEGLAYLHQAESSLADSASAYNIPPDRVVLEITERQAVEDFPRLVHYIEGLRSRGFKIAIDDAGEGYSSLRTIADLRPEFIKIDRSLIRAIDSNGNRRALLSTIMDYADRIGSSVIAEGVETRDELATVVELGVPYVQGYLLGKPNDEFRGLRREMRDFIADRLVHRQKRIAGSSYAIGCIARTGFNISPSILCAAVANRFLKNPDLDSVVVTEEGRLLGLVMREPFLQGMKEGEGESPISTAMDSRPLIVTPDTPLEEVARRTTFRSAARFNHDVLVAREGEYVGVVPVRLLMEALLDSRNVKEA